MEGATTLANLASAFPLSQKQGIVKPPQRLEAPLPTVLVFSLYAKIYDLIKGLFLAWWSFLENLWECNFASFGNVRRCLFQT